MLALIRARESRSYDGARLKELLKNPNWSARMGGFPWSLSAGGIRTSIFQETAKAPRSVQTDARLGGILRTSFRTPKALFQQSRHGLHRGQTKLWDSPKGYPVALYKACLVALRGCYHPR